MKQFMYFLFLVSGAYLFPMGQGVMATLRKHAPHVKEAPSVHAPTIIETKPGCFKIAWFGGSGDGQPDVKIWSCEYDKNGGNWSQSKIIAHSREIEIKDLSTGKVLEKEDVACWNPVFCKTKDLLFMNAIKKYSNAGDAVMFAPADRAKALTGCEMGGVPPFTFNKDLQLLADPSIKLNKEVVFNAGVLTRSIFMGIDDYIEVARPTFVEIVKKLLSGIE